jgi:arsenate reductase-like glutaredoxin family protein
MYKNSIKENAIKLRKEGNSYSFISAKLSIAKSTLSNWLKNIEFMPNDLFNKNALNSKERLVSLSRVDKLKSIMEANMYAKKEIGVLSKRDHFMFGLAIYLGEGSKIGNYLRISNSDPRIIKFSMEWFKIHFSVDNSNFRIRIHMYPDNNEEEVIRFWMKTLSLKREAFFTSNIDHRKNKKRNKVGVLPYGTAHLSVISSGNRNFGVLLYRKIIASIDFVLK